MFSLIDSLIVLVIFVISILVGFAPKCLNWIKNKRKLAEIKKNKKLMRQINIYDDDDEEEEIYLELELGNSMSSTNSKSPKSSIVEEPNEPKVNFFMNAISLVTGFQSTISIIGLPVEFYYYGFSSLQFTLCLLMAPLVISVFFVPFIYEMKSKSIYEYLDNKFNGSKSVKYFTLIIILLFQFAFASLVLFSAGITLLEIIPESSGINIWMVVGVLGLISLSLALLGLQSVVWANFLQYLIMIACNVTVVVLGIKNFNGQSSSFSQGFYSVWNMTEITGRNKFFNFDENLRSRYTFWNCLIGLMFNTIPTYCLTQQSYMRIKQAKSLRSAKMLVLTIIPFGFLNLFLILALGFVMFAYFYKCGDPFTNKQIENQNQLLAKFLTQFYDKYTGLLGLYVALIISSSIGTLASVLKGLGVTISEDIISNFLKYTIKCNEKKKSNNQNFNMRRFSDRFENSYEEELLSLQISYSSKRKKRKLLKRYIDKRKKPNKKLSLCSIVLCGAIIVGLSGALKLAPGSLNSTAYSLLNAIHGPLLFIYICAYFNEFSAKRNLYAQNRCSTSKLRNFQIMSFDVIISSIIAICLVEFMFVGKLVTYKQAEEFYNFEKLPVATVSKTTVELMQFCDNRPWNYSDGNVSLALIQNLTAPSTNSSLLDRKSNKTSIDNKTVNNYLYYLFAVSFNWFPFIGFLACCVSLLIFNLFRLFVSYFFKCFLKKVLK